MSLWKDFFNERNFPCLLWVWQYGGDFLFLVEGYFLAGAIMGRFWSLPSSWLGQQDWQRLFGEVLGDGGVPSQPGLGHSTRGSSGISRRAGGQEDWNNSQREHMPVLIRSGFARQAQTGAWSVFSVWLQPATVLVLEKPPQTSKTFFFCFWTEVKKYFSCFLKADVQNTSQNLHCK